MEWLNFLKLVMQKSLEELLLLVLSVLWLLVRLLRVVVKRKERGNLIIKLGKRKIVEIKGNSSSARKRIGRGI